MARLADDRTAETPMELNLHLKEDGNPLPDATLYRRLVGSLIYLTMTRPDIAYAVQIESPFVSNIHKNHLSAVHHILRHINGTTNKGLFYSSTSPLPLKAYADVDWPGCQDTRRSTTGWCMILGTSPISWKHKKQPTVSKSSTEGRILGHVISHK